MKTISLKLLMLLLLMLLSIISSFLVGDIWKEKLLICIGIGLGFLLFHQTSTNKTIWTSKKNTN